MTVISYPYDDGFIEIEVDDEFAEKYARLEEEEDLREKRDKHRKKREHSLEWYRAMGWDCPDYKSKTPEEIYIGKEEREEKENRFIGLTDYQRRVAVKFFIEHRSQADIAREEKVSRMSICRLIAKIQKKVIKRLI